MTQKDSKPPHKKAPCRGRPGGTGGDKPTCSIPAKYETVLFTCPRERKGFGSEGIRFGSDETDNPGPGQYSLPQCSRRAEESTSKKGYGPMTSKAKRFNHRARYTGPGPGAYVVATQLPDHHMHLSATSSFHPKVPKVKDVPKEEYQTPGPGEYDNVITRTGQPLDFLAAPQSHVSAFKAPGHKVALAGNADSPGPSKYTLMDPWEVTSKAGSRVGSHACTSSFAGRSVTSLTSIPAIVFLDSGAGGKDQPDTGPGPGAYDLEQNTLRTALTKAAARPSAAFRRPEHVDRMGAPLPLPQRQTSAAPMHVGRNHMDDLGHESRVDGGSPGPWDASRAKGVSAPFKSRVPAH